MQFNTRIVEFYSRKYVGPHVFIIQCNSMCALCIRRKFILGLIYSQIADFKGLSAVTTMPDHHSNKQHFSVSVYCCECKQKGVQFLEQVLDYIEVA